jgi:hypothetical protein
MKKRKYNRSGKYSKKPSETPQSITESIKEQSSDNLQVDKIKQRVLVVDDTLNIGHKLTEAIINSGKGEVITRDSFTFEDLPLSIRIGVERTIETRKLRGLFDDSKERKQRALEYWRQNG